MPHFGRAFTACVGKSGTTDDLEPLKRHKQYGKPKQQKPEVPEPDQPMVKELSEEFLARVQSEAVAIQFVDHGDTSITGYVCVRNDAPDKQVVVRYTLNGWDSFGEVSAEWLGSIETQSCDKFRFSILSLKTPYTVYLAARYEVLGKHYWDNNHQKNYEIVHGYDSKTTNK